MDKKQYYTNLLTELNKYIKDKENIYNQINLKVKEEKYKIKKAPYFIASALRLVWKDNTCKLNEIKHDLKFLRKKRRNTKYLLRKLTIS